MIEQLILIPSVIPKTTRLWNKTNQLIHAGSIQSIFIIVVVVVVVVLDRD